MICIADVHCSLQQAAKAQLRSPACCCGSSSWSGCNASRAASSHMPWSSSRTPGWGRRGCRARAGTRVTLPQSCSFMREGVEIIQRSGHVRICEIVWIANGNGRLQCETIIKKLKFNHVISNPIIYQSLWCKLIRRTKSIKVVPGSPAHAALLGHAAAVYNWAAVLTGFPVEAE